VTAVTSICSMSNHQSVGPSIMQCEHLILTLEAETAESYIPSKAVSFAADNLSAHRPQTDSRKVLVKKSVVEVGMMDKSSLAPRPVLA